MKRLLLILLAVFACRPAAAQRDRGATALADLLAGLGTTTRVLVIGAHPDDEDTRLITWLARGHHVDVAYLSLTRGDGGQNLIGNELGEALGVIRTEELLAARRIDGGHQYFARAYDFGFSKSAAEAFQHWPHDSLLLDVVTVVRAFRPQVIVSVFSGTPQDGHGQHQVAGILAREAFDAAGDSARFPARVTQGLAPWTPLKFYRNRTYWGNEGATLRYNSGAYDPLLGESYSELASESRSQHKSQGFGVLPRKGAQVGSLKREETRVNGAQDATTERSIFDGIDTTWSSLAHRSRTPIAGAVIDSVPPLIARARAAYDPWNPSRVAPTLARLASIASAALPRATDDASLVLARLKDDASRALLLSAGVAIEASADRDLVAVGDSLPVSVTVYDRGPLPVTVRGVELGGASIATRPGVVAAGGVGPRVAPDSAWTLTLAAIGRSVTQPWWLTSPRRGDMFTQPVSVVPADERADAASARVSLSVGDEESVVETIVPVLHRFADPVKGEIDHPLAVAPAVSVTLDRTVGYAPAGARLDRELHVTLRSASPAGRQVTVSLELPRGLSADSARRTVTLAGYDAQRMIAFRLRGTLPAGRQEVAVRAESDGERFAAGYVAIDYDHIRPQRLYRPASIELQSVDVKLPPNLNVAYVQGVGDNSAPMLQELGIPVTVLDAAKLATTELAPFTTIVIGTRAYEADPALAAQNPRLFEWVRRGGTLVVQYGQYEMTQPGYMPYPITLSRPAARVTDEHSPITVLHPGDPLLTTPNRIGDADWDGWVQDRTYYMPTTIDAHYGTSLATEDPGEPPNEGSILETPMGRGVYVYTTLAFFRQLPVGVPGAARIFVNLLGARQAESPRTTP